MSRRRNNSLQKRVRNELINIFGKRCWYCGRSHSLTLHHIKEWSKGGETTKENGALLCSCCHQKMNSLLKQDYNLLNKTLLEINILGLNTRL